MARSRGKQKDERDPGLDGPEGAGGLLPGLPEMARRALAFGLSFPV